MATGNKLSLEDYNALITRIRERDLPDAEHRHDAARESLDEQALELQARGDTATLKRLEKAERDAAEYLAETRRALDRAFAGAERKVAELNAQKLAQKRAQLEELIAERIQVLSRVDELLEQLANEHVRLRELWERMSATFDAPPKCGWPLTFLGFQNIAELRLWGLSGGLWYPRSVGLETHATAKALPGLAARARNEREVLLSELRSPQPPRAA